VDGTKEILACFHLIGSPFFLQDEVIESPNNKYEFTIMFLLYLQSFLIDILGCSTAVNIFVQSQ